jgi:hypothetical protein
VRTNQVSEQMTAGGQKAQRAKPENPMVNNRRCCRRCAWNCRHKPIDARFDLEREQRAGA